MHTSTVTVSVIDPNSLEINPDYQKISNKDFKVDWFSGTGAGGMHRNKKMNSCRLTHTPTGLVETRQGRKREANLKQAKDALLALLRDKQYNHRSSHFKVVKKNQVGSGMRGDKIRTYRFQDNQVIDHQTGKSCKSSDIMKGKFDLLWT